MFHSADTCFTFCRECTAYANFTRHWDRYFLWSSQETKNQGKGVNLLFLRLTRPATAMQLDPAPNRLIALPPSGCRLNTTNSAPPLNRLDTSMPSSLSRVAPAITKPTSSMMPTPQGMLSQLGGAPSELLHRSDQERRTQKQSHVNPSATSHRLRYPRNMPLLEQRPLYPPNRNLGRITWQKQVPHKRGSSDGINTRND